jgi:D-serine deaminase-like pyridoxal phosphate-dependent protein
VFTRAGSNEAAARLSAIEPDARYVASKNDASPAYTLTVGSTDARARCDRVGSVIVRRAGSYYETRVGQAADGLGAVAARALRASAPGSLP